MYRYRVQIGRTEEGKPIHENVIAGTCDVEGGCLVFRKVRGLDDIICVYKAYDNMVRMGKEPDEQKRS